MTVSPQGQSSSRKLLKATAVMASGTMVSRILGFARVMMIAFVLGNGTRQADIFSIAQTVPNSLFMLFAGGALNTVLVPQIVRAIRKDPDGGEKFVSRLMTAFLMLLAAITVIVTLITPWIMTLYTNSGWRSPALAEHWEALVLLAYITMPQIFFYGAFFLVGQVLNAREKFGPMMWAPAANNVVSILVFALYAVIWGSSGMHAEAFTTTQTMFLGFGATAGIIVQTVILLPFMSRLGFKFRPRFDFKNSGLGHTFSLAKWTLLYVGVNQLALIVVDRLATAATVGGQGAGVTAYLNAYLVWILPHSLITVSLATAMLPSASRLAAAGDFRGVGEETLRTMRLSSTFLLPAAVGFIALGLPFAQLTFGHGSGSGDADFVGWTLMAFSFGLIPFTLQYVCLRAFYALEDTRTPFYIQCVIAVVNASLAVAFIFPWNDPNTVAPRLALAFSAAYAVGWVTSFLVLRRRLPGLQARNLLQHLVRLTIASIPAGVGAWLVSWGISQWSDRFLAQLIGLILGVVVAVVIFLVLSRRLRINEVQQTLALLRHRGRTPEVAEAAEEQDSEMGEPAPPTVEMPTAAEVGAIEEYPDLTTADEEPTQDIGTWEGASTTVSAGQILDDRYRLDGLLATRAEVQTWRAFDLTLSRPVLMHLLPNEDPRTDTILAAARKSAGVTDARFLRVLDAFLVHSDDYGAYIVCEYVPGNSLRKILQDGPLSSLEAAWVVREVADALTWIHAQDVHHRELTPDNIIITSSGNVKIVGLLIEAALNRTPTSAHGGQSDDLHAVGALLYACLSAQWPGTASFGMPGAPVQEGRVLSPREVVPGVSAALDDVCDRLVNPRPATGDENEDLTTAMSVVLVLNRILGTADAVQDLEKRVKAPVRPLFSSSAVLESANSPEPVERPSFLKQSFGAADHEDDLSSMHTVELSSSMTSDAGSFFTPVPPPTNPAPTATATLPSPPESPTPAAPKQSKPRRTWLIVLTAIVALVLIASLAIMALTRPNTSSAPEPTTSTTTPSSAPVKIVRAIDFDPTQDGGSGDEMTSEAASAIDGNPETRWRTESYRGSAQLGGLKPGVGLVVDLGSAQDVTSVAVTFSGQNTAADVRVPVEAATGDEPPLRSRSQWRTVANKSQLSGRAVFEFPKTENTRYLLIYLTSLPTDGSGYRGGIFEIEVNP